MAAAYLQDGSGINSFVTIGTFGVFHLQLYPMLPLGDPVVHGCSTWMWHGAVMNHHFRFAVLSVPLWLSSPFREG